MHITVVGAGIVGCAVAHELACRGARVRVVDPRGTGLGATRASAGILAPYIEGHHRPLLDLGLQSLALYDSFVDRVRAGSGLPLEYDRSGSLQIALNDDEAASLQSLAAALARDAVPHEALCRREAMGLEPGLSLGLVSALLIPAHGYVAASALIAGLVGAAVAKGVAFSSDHVEAVEPGPDTLAVVTQRGATQTDAVVLCAGSWSSRIRMGAAVLPRLPVTPVRGQLIHLHTRRRPASRVLWRGASDPGRPGTASSYLVPWADGSVLAGATVEDVGFDESQTPDAVAWLRGESAALLPETADASLHEVRVGLRPRTPDGLPLVGASSTMRNVFYATGHHRNGVLLAPLTAVLVADLLLAGRSGPGLAHTRPDRFGW